MLEIIAISAEKRERGGKGNARAARRAGRVPCVIYGAKKDPIMISLEGKQLGREINKQGFFVRQYDIEVDGANHHVLPRDVQLHPVTDQPIHVDFLRVTVDTKLHVNIEVLFRNEEESPGLKRGGVINVVRHEVEVVCTVSSIPSAFEVDLTGLDIGDSVHISDLNLPEGVVPTIADRDFTIATIAAPTVVVEPEPEDVALKEGEEGEAEEGTEEGTEEGKAVEGVNSKGDPGDSGS
jgi:large subunit ribosomal protein L25